MRRIGRLRSEASPSKVAAIGWLPATPIIRREPVPALPKSSTPAGSDEAADAGAADAPAAGRLARDVGSERPAGRGGAQDVVALEQALDPGLADGEEPEDERPVRDRLVAGNPQAPFQAGAAPRPRPVIDGVSPCGIELPVSVPTGRARITRPHGRHPPRRRRPAKGGISRLTSPDAATNGSALSETPDQGSTPWPNRTSA